MVPDMAPEQVLEVKYETLIEEPEETLNKICLFLDVQFQPSVLEYDQNSTYSKPDAALTYQWRRKLTPER
nr:sulfotransferase [Shimia gijangensis]